MLSFRAVGPHPQLVCKADCLQRSYTKNAFGTENIIGRTGLMLGLEAYGYSRASSVTSDLGTSILGAQLKVPFNSSFLAKH